MGALCRQRLRVYSVQCLWYVKPNAPGNCWLTSGGPVLCWLWCDSDASLWSGGGIWRQREGAQQRSRILHDQLVSKATEGDSAANVSIVWTVFALVFLVASLPTNVVYIIIFFCVELGFMLVAASYFAVADGHPAASTALKKGGGAFCFLAGLTGKCLPAEKRT